MLPYIYEDWNSSLHKSFRKLSTKLKCNLAQISKSPDENIFNSKITLCSFLLDFSVPEGVGDKMVVICMYQFLVYIDSNHRERLVGGLLLENLNVHQKSRQLARSIHCKYL